LMIDAVREIDNVCVDGLLNSEATSCLYIC